MSRKHYKAIAAEIKSRLTGNKSTDDTIEYVALGLCEVMKRDNPRFNPYTFMEACGLPTKQLI